MDVNTAKAIASTAICVAGAFTMYITNGTTGIGWAVLGIDIIWD
tara:strand:+ start:5475 stop:5606 length:132 start_codon:yes stop_codon:yes gene_type:complete